MTTALKPSMRAVLFSLLPGATALHAHSMPQRTVAPPTRAAASMLAETDKPNWCQDVEACDRLTVVFFYAPWCRNCKAVRPRLERLEREYDQARFLQCNFKKAALCVRRS